MVVIVGKKFAKKAHPVRPQVPSTLPFIRFRKFHSGSLQNLE
ncbi:hypothetical protein CIPAW_16G036300 [Carya illinoinensis]|uniref:Uncharacterized protein n=1 Tax=Carya illinoinensis TaxID=32201 RepID=A0A8T1N377_CARIL|nr:hypothetical protein CIPAW_16G036300 [Carya illinoinensis]